jgi:hypothetical protein
VSYQPTTVMLSLGNTMRLHCAIYTVVQFSQYLGLALQYCTI